MLNENIEDFLRTCRDLLVEGIVPEKYADDGDDPESGDSYEPEEVVIESLINVDTDSMEKDVYTN